MYKLYGMPASRAARILWMLEELEAPYEFIRAMPHSDEVKAVNPSGKVPVLVDGDQVLTDSTAILFYLSDKHGQMTHPVGTPGRVALMNALFFGIDALEQPLWAATRHGFILPEELRRKEEIMPALLHDYSAALNTLGEMLGDRDFILGDDFTIADIVIGHCGAWAKGYGFPEPEGKAGAYLKRLRDRPAFRAMMKLREG